MFRIDGSKQALAQETPIIPWKADAPQLRYIHLTISAIV